ncbi:hypothetical protein [Rhodanobacter lindaniclasticus]
MLRVWHALLYLGDGAVLLPCSALLLVWLLAAPASRRTGWWWLGAVLLVCGGVAASKLLYMVTGWHPAGWDFIGLSGHAALSFLFFPVAAALATSRCGTGLRASLIAFGGCIALAISVASWVLGDHSVSELVLGALWGGLAAAIFLAITWRHVAEVPMLRTWGIASLLLLAAVAYRHEFPSARVLGWIALQANDRTTIYTRAHLERPVPLPNAVADSRPASPPSTRRRVPSTQTP